jgi:hypothetical protein
MELSWFLAWAMFSSLLAMHRPFPFFETVAAFSLACLITRFTTGRGWRVVNVLIVELSGLLLGALLIFHRIYYHSYNLFDADWLIRLYSDPRSVTEWLIFTLNMLLTIVLLAGGVALARRPNGYSSACNRFDLGLAAFFALFLIKLVALTKEETLAEDTLSLLFVFPFFLSGLLSLVVSRSWGNTGKQFLPGHRTTGVIVGFFAAVLVGVSLSLLFFLPGLTAAARLGQQALAAAGKPLIPVIVSFLHFIFGPRGSDPVATTGKSPHFSDAGKLATDPPGWWTALFEKAMVWGIIGLLVAALAIAAAFILFFTVKWLFSKTENTNARSGKSLFFRVEALLAMLKSLVKKFMDNLGGHRNASALYGALLAWGSRSGSPHTGSETPAEFGMRLQMSFPEMKPSIDVIIETYNREVYGEKAIDSTILDSANAALRRLHSPRLWLTRMKRRLIDNATETQ